MWELSVFNSLAPGKFEWNFRHVIFKQISLIDGWGISGEIALIWMSLDFTDDQSRLVQVMAWCHQATSHYLSQYWPKSLLPYGVTRPQWVNLVHLSLLLLDQNANYHTPTNEVEEGLLASLCLSICPFICLYIPPCVKEIESALYLTQYIHIHFIFTHIISQIKKVCCMLS